LLEKVNEVVMHASFKLSSSLSLDIYKSFNTAVLANNKKITSLPMAGSSTKPIYIAPLPSEKVTKNAAPQSSWFEGQLILPKDDLGRKVDINNFQYIITEGPPVKKANGGSPPKEVKTKAEEYKEGLRDYQCQMIAKMEGDEAENLYKEVLAANPGFVGAHLSMIQSVETPSGADLKNQLPFAFKKQIRESSDVEDLKVKLSKIAKLAGLVIEGINQDTLLAYYGLKSDNRPDAAKIKQQMEKQKQQLLDAYVKKAVAMGKLSVIQENFENAEEIDGLMVEAMKFADVNDLKVS
jgi:tripeptidyl-peptidase II